MPQHEVIKLLIKTPLNSILEIEAKNSLNRLTKIKILILALNLQGTDQLGLNNEIREIQYSLERGKNRERFTVVIRVGVRISELQSILLREEPRIVHFFGHGTGSQGLVLETTSEQQQLLDTQTLADLFRLFSNQVECVVLNACYSQVQAAAINQHINYVIGTKGTIRDDAAIAFTKGFYEALGDGETIERAYDFGCNAILLANPDIPEHLKPILLKKKDLNQIELLPLDVVVAKITFDEEPELPQQLEFETVTVNSSGKVIKTETYQASYYEQVLVENNPPLVMMGIPEGEFIMGSPETEPRRHNSESPQHQVKVAPFWLAQTPITNAQWNFVANLPQIQRKLNSKESNREDDHPVTDVSWYDAMEFCARLSRYTGRDYRLPSEAEWEYACRAGTKTPFHFGDTITSELANYACDVTYAEEPAGEYRGKTVPVKSFPPNAFGLYDMHGNVDEWCAHPWHENYQGAPEDSRVWDEQYNNDNYYQNIAENLAELLKDNRERILRGGSWSIYPGACRSAYRLRDNPVDSNGFLGFRVACGGART